MLVTQTPKANKLDCMVAIQNNVSMTKIMKKKSLSMLQQGLKLYGVEPKSYKKHMLQHDAC